MTMREQAVELLEKYVKTPHIVTHSYAVEAVMRALAKKLAPNKVEEWGAAGLLHDLDEDEVDWRSDMRVHGPKSVEIMRQHNFGTEEMYQAILAHNPLNGKRPQSTFEFAMLASDPMTGFIKAIAEVYPDKRLKSVKPASIMKRMRETRFATGANRDYMLAIERTGIKFDQFAQIALEAMKEIDQELGLDGGPQKKADILKYCDDHNIPYTLKEHRPVCTVKDMIEVGMDQHGTLGKNLFVRDQKGERHFLIILPGPKPADLNKISQQLGSSKLSFASDERLMKYLKTQKGGVSPFAILNDETKEVEVVIDQEMVGKPAVAFHPNDNTCTLFVAFDDMITMIKDHGNKISYVDL